MTAFGSRPEWNVTADFSASVASRGGSAGCSNLLISPMSRSTSHPLGTRSDWPRENGGTGRPKAKGILHNPCYAIRVSRVLAPGIEDATEDARALFFLRPVGHVCSRFRASRPPWLCHHRRVPSSPIGSRRLGGPGGGSLSLALRSTSVPRGTERVAGGQNKGRLPSRCFRARQPSCVFLRGLRCCSTHE